jgi:hypothetical protein
MELFHLYLHLQNVEMRQFLEMHQPRALDVLLGPFCIRKITKTETKTETKTLFRFCPADLQHRISQRLKKHMISLPIAVGSRPLAPVVAPGRSVAISCAPTPLSPPATPPQLPLRPGTRTFVTTPCEPVPLSPPPANPRTSVAAGCASARPSPPAAYSDLRLRPRTFHRYFLRPRTRKNRQQEDTRWIADA